MSQPETFTATVTKEPGDEFKHGVLRDKHEILSDEPSWLPVGAGQDAHPVPVDLLMGSLAMCQVSVLDQCLEANGVTDYEIHCEAELDEFSRDADHPDEMPRHTALRIDHVTLDITVTTTPEFAGQTETCLDVYDEGCIVGQSLAGGIDYTPVTSVELRE